MYTCTCTTTLLYTCSKYGAVVAKRVLHLAPSTRTEKSGSRVNVMGVLLASLGLVHLHMTFPCHVQVCVLHVGIASSVAVENKLSQGRDFVYSSIIVLSEH